MPRKSSAALLSMLAVDGSPPRLKPPATLSQAERDIFTSLVSTVDRRHFRPSDLPLLSSYCRAIDLEARAAKALADDPCDKQWLSVWEKSVRAMTALSMRLRLSPQARLPDRAVARQKPVIGPRPWA